MGLAPGPGARECARGPLPRSWRSAAVIAAGAGGRTARTPPACSPAASTCRWCRRSSSGDRTQAMTALGELERDSRRFRLRRPGRRCWPPASTSRTANWTRQPRELAAVAQQSKDHDLAMIARLRLARVQVAQGKRRCGARDAGDGAMPEPSPRATTRCAAMPTSPRATSCRRSPSTAAPRAGSAGAPNPVLDLKIADLAADSRPRLSSRRSPRPHLRRSA